MFLTQSLLLIALILWIIFENVMRDIVRHFFIALIILVIVTAILSAISFGFGCLGGLIYKLTAPTSIVSASIKNQPRAIQCPYCQTPRTGREAFCLNCGRLIFKEVKNEKPINYPTSTNHM